MTTACSALPGAVEDAALASPRRCPLCDADRATLLHDNAMVSIDRFPFSYPVVACDACGMVYAARALAPAAMDRYYRELSKYADGETSDFDRHRLRLAARFVRRVAEGRGRLLDVGCSTGAFLTEAVAQGIAEVAGIETSPAAVAVARDRHGFDVQLAQAQSFAGYASFDIVTVLAVLEHLREPAAYLRELARQLAPGATLVLEVPDADAFGSYEEPGRTSEPFGEFSLEHINFFGVEALRRLGRDAGLTLVRSETNRLTNGGAALLVAYRRDSENGKDGATGAARRVDGTRCAASVARYIDRCAAAMVDVDRRLAALEARATPVVVYGAGSHTARLLTRDAFTRLDVARIVDRNPHLVGRSMAGVAIASPDVVGDDPRMPVLVSSFNASDAIVRELRARFENEIVVLYGAAPASRQQPLS